MLTATIIFTVLVAAWGASGAIVDRIGPAGRIRAAVARRSSKHESAD